MITRIGPLVVAALVSVPSVVRADEAADVTDELACSCCTGDESVPCAGDSTDVVGYRRCAAYGAWGSNLRAAYMFLDIGMNVRHFAPRAMGTGIARTTMPTTPADNGDSVLTFDEHVGFGLSHHLYMALDLEFGNFANFDTVKTGQREFLLDGLVSLGVRGGLGPFVLSVEVAGGVMESAYPKDSDVNTEGIVEARGRADLWLSPWFSVGGLIGTSLIDHGDTVAGLFLGFHTWAYGGDRD